MTDRPGILVVAVAAGTGHLRAADAVVAALRERHPGTPVEQVELLSLAPRWVRAMYGAGFEAVATHAPRLWQGIYHATDGPVDRSPWAPAAQRTLFRAFRRLLLSRPWRACLTTHFLPAQLAAGRSWLPPFGMVVTDFELHRVWVQPRVSRYFVATDAVAGELTRRVPGAAVTVSGIPVSPDVARAPGRLEARGALGLDDDRPIALVLGGGLGIGVEESTLAALEAAPEAVQVVAVCGRNEGARERLARHGVPAERLRVHGYLAGLSSWMAAADLVATKPGGLSVSEALALGRPLLLTRPIPGAEEGNTRAVVAAGAAIAGRHLGEIRDGFRRAFTEPGLLDALASAAAAIGRPHAAATIADALMEPLEHGPAATGNTLS